MSESIEDQVVLYITDIVLESGSGNKLRNFRSYGVSVLDEAMQLVRAIESERGQ